MGLGIILSFAASPAVAERIGLGSFHFATRQIIFMIPALAAMISVSFLEAREVRRLALVMLCGSLLLMVAVLYIGVEVKGAHRWISFFGMSIQPSEFMKPAFVIVCAWLFAEHARQPDIPGNLFAVILLGLVMALLVAQPDLGQTILVVGTWGVMFFMAGMPWLWIIVIGAIGAAGAISAYTIFPHVAGRIDRFLTGEGDTFQVDMGREAVVQGGWFGVGPGEGTIKRVIPDSHADFVFAVAGEEFGIVLCFLILGIFAFIVLRGLNTALKEHDDFTRYAVAGLVVVFGFQSIINMGVNLQMMPAKGMTLPFISYGGSSLIAIAISMGMVLALTRKKPEKRKQLGFPELPRRPAPAE
jgi:cell division protein FtsW